MNQKDVNISLMDGSLNHSAGLAKDHLSVNDSKGILTGVITEQHIQKAGCSTLVLITDKKGEIRLF